MCRNCGILPEQNLFCGNQVVRLGFGAMRLPVDPSTGKVAEKEAERVIDLAYNSGLNYFDTAFSYHGGASETILGAALRKYPRENWYIASKMPGHEINPKFDPAIAFEEQLRRLGVDYFDYYLLHNVHEGSLPVYTDKNLKVLDYVLEQKKNGRIRHLGFSSHGRIDMLEKFLDDYGDLFEFVQIQLNYVDWTLQSAREKYELITDRGLEVIVMEPCRGGKLADPGEPYASKMKALRPDESCAAWAFDFVRSLPNVKMVLSGMTTLEQVWDNVKTFTNSKLLSDEEMDVVRDIAGGISNMMPCTACRYCCSVCPQGLNIPLLLKIYNDAKYQQTMNLRMGVDSMPEDKRPSACIKCKACMKMCPQNINIPECLEDCADILSDIRSWEDESRVRAEVFNRLIPEKDQ